MNVLRTLCILLCSLALSFCGQIEEPELSRDTVELDDALETAVISFKLSGEGAGEQPPLDFSFSGQVVGCLSGTDPLIDETTTTLELYLGDEGCAAQLNSLELEGLTFAPSAQTNSWGAGDSVMFSALSEQGEQNYLEIQVAKQLSSPIEENNEISFSLRKIDQLSQAQINRRDLIFDAALDIIGSKTPNLSLVQTQLSILTGQIFLNLSFDCQDDLNVVQTEIYCQDESVHDLKYLVVRGSGGNNFADLDQLFLDQSQNIKNIADEASFGIKGFTVKARMTIQDLFFTTQHRVIFKTSDDSYLVQSLTLD